MGSFANSVQVRCDDPQRVAEAIRKLLAERGYAPTDDAPDADASGMHSPLRAVHVLDGPSPWVGVLDSDLISASTLAADLSRELSTYAIQMLVNDSDSWCYQLFGKGHELDVFDSQGDLFQGWDEAPSDLDAILDEQLPSEVTDRIREFEDRLLQSAPPPVQQVIERVQNGTASPEDMTQYRDWLQNQTPKVMKDVMQSLDVEVTRGFGGSDALDRDEFERRLNQRLPPGILDIKSRLSSNDVSPEETEQYMQWLQQEMPGLLDEIRQSMVEAPSKEMSSGETAPGETASDEVLADSEAEMARRIREWDKTIPPAMREIIERIHRRECSDEDLEQYAEWFHHESPKLDDAAKVSLPKVLTREDIVAEELADEFDFSDRNRDDFTGQHPEFDDDLRDHARRLQPILRSGAERSELLRVLNKQSIFAEETLAEFLSLIGAPSFYAQLSYSYLGEFSVDELSDAKIRRVDELRFRQGDVERPQASGDRPADDDSPDILRFPGS